MKSTSTQGDTVGQMDTIGGERRDDRRYEIKLDVRWKLVRRRRVIDSGMGHTLDLSRGGIRFHAGRALPVGLNIEMSVAWPARLHNIAPMQLSVQGKIVRSADGWAAIRTFQHEFRTLGVPPANRQTLPDMGNTPELLLSPFSGHGLRKLH
jgi:PilZ domain